MEHRGQSIPLHVQVKNDILAKITEGTWGPGTRLDPELELARQYGVSRITIRQALNDLAIQGYVDRVKKRGTIVTDLARTASQGAWVGMVTIDTFSYMVQCTSEGVDRALASNGLKLRMFATNNNPDEAERVIKQAVDDGAQGLIIYAAEDTTYSPMVYELKRKGYPLCLFDKPLLQVATDVVMTDHAEGGLLATNHLIERGHRRIGFVAGVNPSLTYPVGARYNGYKAAMEQAGLTIEPELTVTGQSGDMSWVDDMKRMLVDKQPSAVFAVNDKVASIILQTASAFGLSVPGDLAVVGFDNTSIVAKFAVPLTTIDQPFEEIGAAAVSLLMERMSGRRTNISWTILPPKLVVRGSSS